MTFLISCGLIPKLNINSEKFSYYDIYVENPFLSFEVKFDIKSSVTSNLAFEHHNCKLDKASGINISQADFWCHCVYEKKVPTLYFARLSELLKFVEDNEPHKRIIAGGDDNANLFLYRKNDMLGNFNSGKPLITLNVEQAKTFFGVNDVLSI